MALTTLAHTRHTEVPAANNITSILDSIFNMLNASATWTPTKELDGPDTVAVFAVPVAAEVSDLRIVFAGVEAGAPTPTMKSPDTFVVQTLLLGMSRGVTGAIGAWDDANPFADGEFSGYSRALSAFGTYSVDEVQLYESAETLWVLRRSITDILGCAAGALYSSDDTNPLNSEDGEGRVYGMITPFTTSGTWGGLQGPAGSFTFGVHVGGAGQPHSYAFEPGGSFVAADRMGVYEGSTAAGELLDRAGAKRLVPDHFYWKGSVLPYYLGRYREVYGIVNSLHGQVLLDGGGSPMAEILSISTISAGNAIALLV